MRIHRVFIRALLLTVVPLTLSMTGCSTSVVSDTMPGVDVDAFNSFYVRKLPQDERGVQRLISDRLNAMGKKSTWGVEAKPDHTVDAIVTYQDRWMWDITMYMLDLDVQVRDPETDVELASGHTHRTSLARKPPEFMVEEVLSKIFQ